MIFIDCVGDGRTCGQAHGEEARDLIRGVLERWEESIVGASGMPVARYVSNFLSRTKFVAAINAQVPNLLEEMRGIAEGAGVPFDILVAYNCMDEQWWYDLERAPDTEPGCSVIAIAAAADSSRPPILAQNMDLPAFMGGAQLLLRIRAPGRPETLVLTSAGLIGLTGVNHAGIGVCVNTLMMLEHTRTGLPVAAVLRGALGHQRLGATVAFLQSVLHASGQHYAVGSSEGVVGIECSAAGVIVSSPSGRPTLTHTNHPLVSEHINSVVAGELDRRGRIRDSKERLAFLDEHIGSIATPADAKRLLSDRSTPICIVSASERQTQTFGSVVFELMQPPRANFCPGLPTSGEWHQPSWNTSD